MKGEVHKVWDANKLKLWLGREHKACTQNFSDIHIQTISGICEDNIEVISRKQAMYFMWWSGLTRNGG